MCYFPVTCAYRAYLNSLSPRLTPGVFFYVLSVTSMTDLLPRCPNCGKLTYESYQELVLPSGGSADEWIEAEAYYQSLGVDVSHCVYDCGI